MQTFNLPNDSIVSVHNIFDQLPDFMLSADCIFTDLPYNLSLLNGFYTKAGRSDYRSEFPSFYHRLFECVESINPSMLFLEIGKEWLAELVIECKKRYKFVTFYNSTYYHKKECKCYIIQASRKRMNLHLDYMDEEDAIAWICANMPFECIGDLCMGTGLVGYYAWKNGKRFVGTELNEKRLAVLVDRINREGNRSNG